MQDLVVAYPVIDIHVSIERFHQKCQAAFALCDREWVNIRLLMKTALSTS